MRRVQKYLFCSWQSVRTSPAQVRLQMHSFCGRRNGPEMLTCEAMEKVSDCLGSTAVLAHYIPLITICAADQCRQHRQGRSYRTQSHAFGRRDAFLLARVIGGWNAILKHQTDIAPKGQYT